MKKSKKKKLTKHEKEIHLLLDECSAKAEEIRLLTYAQNQAEQKLQTAESKLADMKRSFDAANEKINRLSSEVVAVAEGLFQVKEDATDVPTMQRHIGYAEGRLDAANSVVTGYQTRRSHADAAMAERSSIVNSGLDMIYKKHMGGL